MNQKTVIIILGTGTPEVFGSFKKFCADKGLIYQTLLNKGKTPKIGEPVTIGNFIIHKVQAK